jgi:hypothetical protein
MTIDGEHQDNHAVCDVCGREAVVAAATGFFCGRHAIDEMAGRSSHSEEPNDISDAPDSTEPEETA